MLRGVSVHSDLPTIAFVIPVLNAGEILPSCLRTIEAQDYPRELVEIIVADGGSRDDTVEIARSFGATVINNPKKLAEPGVDLGLKAASSEIVFVMAADNGLPRRDWLKLMVKPFMERQKAIGVFTQIVFSADDNSFTRYYCRLHVEPFTWFVYGPAANPRKFHRAYQVSEEDDRYVIFKFTPMRHPLVALAQGFGVRSSFVRRKGFEHDDILPIIQMIEDGYELVYVPDAGIYHHHLASFGEFIRKYRWRIRNSLYEENVGFDNRSKYMSRGRKLRKYLFAPYGLSVILPLVDSIRLGFKEKDMCMLWHAPASFMLSWMIVWEYVRKCVNSVHSVHSVRKDY